MDTGMGLSGWSVICLVVVLVLAMIGLKKCVLDLVSMMKPKPSPKEYADHSTQVELVMTNVSADMQKEYVFKWWYKIPKVVYEPGNSGRPFRE